ncbi:MAG: hypothetical protein HYW63_03975 [Candidatus Levybacteria bacterium]|nr:hypothetical protein [Candidatus Levybacteria bacterium]
MHELIKKHLGDDVSWPRLHFQLLLIFFLLIGLLITVYISSQKGNQNTPSQANAVENSGMSNLSKLSELTTQLLQATKAYQKSTEPNKKASLDNLLSIAQKRKQIMLTASEKAPAAFTLSSIPSSLLKHFPEETKGLIEEEIEATGKLTVIHFDSEGKKGEIVYELSDQSSGRTYELHFVKGQPDLYTGSIVKAKGILLDNELVVAASGKGGGSDLTTVLSQASGPTGDQHTIAMLINFTNNSTYQPWTPTEVSGVLFTNNNSVDALYKDSSFNTTGFSGDVTNWMTVPYDNTNCSSMYSTWASAADQAATSAGYDLSSYTRKLYVLAGPVGCSYNGWSSIGGNPSRSYVTMIPAGLVAHELGHAIGMWHASTISCGSKAIDSYSQCSVSDYGDPYDVMGEHYITMYPQNGAHKVEQTWIPSSRIQTVGLSGTYTISPLEIDTTSTQVLKILKPDSYLSSTGNSYYYVDYRLPTGFDSSLPLSMTQGAGVVIWPVNKNDPSTGSYNNRNTARLDTTPGDGDFSNSALSDGSSFEDLINGITITQTSHSSQAAEVEIAFGPGICIKSSPSLSISPSSQTGSAGQTLNYSVTVNNNDSLTCLSTTFGFDVSGLPAGSSFSAPSLTLVPGEAGSISLSITTSADQADGSFPFTLTATDTGDPNHTGSSQATLIVYTDNIGPTITINKPEDGSKINPKGNLQISASATDSSGIGSIKISFDGSILNICTNKTTCSASILAKTIGTGSHVITVSATDKAPTPNTSSKSITIIK